MSGAGHAALWCKSHFSFLEGASTPAELVTTAGQLDLAAVALTDRDGIYGAPAAYQANRSQDNDPRLFDGKLNPILLLGPLFLLVRRKTIDSPDKRERWFLAGFAIFFVLYASFMVDMRKASVCLPGLRAVSSM